MNADSRLAYVTEQMMANIARVSEAVELAAGRSGRSSSEVEIVAVSKTFPRALVDCAWEQGLRSFGENRVQEAAAKFSERLPDGSTLRLIGPLQTNKARLAISTFEAIDTVDRIPLIDVLEREAARAGKVVPVLLQVNIGREPQKSGCDPDDAALLVDRLQGSSALRLDGLMAIAPIAVNPEDARPWFRQLRALRESLIRSRPGLELPVLSMGMSGDFEIAIEEGATHVRIGSGIFGAR